MVADMVKTPVVNPVTAKRLVVVIDDEKSPIDYFITALAEIGFTVKQCYGPDEALDFVREKSSDIAVVVLDIMMPPGEKYKDEETSHGFRTGILLYDDLMCFYSMIPIIILTNVNDEETLNYFKEGPWLKIARKVDYKVFEFADLVHTMTYEVQQNSLSMVLDRKCTVATVCIQKADKLYNDGKSDDAEALYRKALELQPSLAIQEFLPETILQPGKGTMDDLWDYLQNR